MDTNGDQQSPIVEIVVDECASLLQHDSIIGVPGKEDAVTAWWRSCLHAARVHEVFPHEVQAWHITQADVEKKRPISPWNGLRGFDGQQ